MKQLPLFIALATVLLFGACKKDDGDDGNLTGTDLLETGKWQLTSFTVKADVNGNPGTPVEQIGTKTACEKDNAMIFKSDSHQVQDEGPTRCNPSDPQQKDLGMWVLTNSNASLTFSMIGAAPAATEVLQLDNTTLKAKQVKAQVLDGANYVWTYIATYKHIN